MKCQVLQYFHFVLLLKYGAEIFSFVANQHQIWRGPLFINGGLHKGASQLPIYMFHGH